MDKTNKTRYGYSQLIHLNIYHFIISWKIGNCYRPELKGCNYLVVMSSLMKKPQFVRYTVCSNKFFIVIPFNPEWQFNIWVSQINNKNIISSTLKRFWLTDYIIYLHSFFEISSLISVWIFEQYNIFWRNAGNFSKYKFAYFHLSFDNFQLGYELTVKFCYKLYYKIL